MPSPIRRMTLWAPVPLMALRIVSVWLPPIRAAPASAATSPFAARLRGSPIDSFLSPSLQPASTTTATAPSPQAVLDMWLTDINAPTSGLGQRIERHDGEQQLTAERNLRLSAVSFSACPSPTVAP